MVWCCPSIHPSVRPSVNIWLSTGVTTCRINFNLTDIMHLVCRIHGNGPCGSLNRCIMTQLRIFAFWSFLRPFLPEASIDLWVACIRPSVTKFVRAITQHPFQLGSSNLDHRCKRPWLRSNLTSIQNLPHFELVREITPHQFKLEPPNLDQRCKIPWLRFM